MNSITKDGKKIDRLYCIQENNIYTHNFFQDVSTGFAYTLAEKSHQDDFFSFEPENCNVEKILKAEGHYNINQSIEHLIESTMSSLMMYGKAYIYIKAEYGNLIHEQNKAETRKLLSLDIREIKGIIKKKSDASILFVSKGAFDEVNESTLETKGLVILNVRDLGFRKNYFTNLIRKLGKYDITSELLMPSEDNEGYDFNVHSKKNKKLVLRATKDIGWVFSTEGLSDSYILYKKMQMDIFKIKSLKYIVNEINQALCCTCGENAGKLVVHIRELDYEKVWDKYQNGEITVTELTNVLYHSS